MNHAPAGGTPALPEARRSPRRASASFGGMAWVVCFHPFSFLLLNLLSIALLRPTVPLASFTIWHSACIVWAIPLAMPAAAPLKEYDAPLDSKKRVVLRGAKHQYFRVAHYPNGVILLKPRVFKDAPVSAKTLRCIEKSLASMKAGKRSKPEDLKKLAAMKI